MPDVGDRVPLRYEARDPDTRDLLAGVSVSLSVTKPDGTLDVPSVTETGTGLFDAQPLADLVGTYFYTWTASGALTDVDGPHQFTAGTAGRLYATVPDLRARLGVTSGKLDADMYRALAAACRRIDRVTRGPHGQFWADAVATARVYAPAGRSFSGPDGDTLLVDDISTTTDLVVQTGSLSTWSTLDAGTYEMGPLNSLDRGWPLWRISLYSASWPSTASGRVRVTARWGWPSIPAEISEAALILGGRLFKRKDSPEGVMGNADWGLIRMSRTDPDVAELIEPFMRPGFA